MKIRDVYHHFNEDDEILEYRNGIDIVSEDGRTLFALSLKGDTLRIDSGDVAMIDGVLHDDKMVITPVSSNCIHLVKPKYND